MEEGEVGNRSWVSSLSTALRDGAAGVPSAAVDVEDSNVVTQAM